MLSFIDAEHHRRVCFAIVVFVSLHFISVSTHPISNFSNAIISMSISIQQLSYIHADKEILFKDLNLSVSKGQKIALIGNNGSGKSTLLQIITGELSPASGTVICPDDLFYVPQHFGQYDGQSISEVLQVDKKIKALHDILNGDASIENFHTLNDDWNIEERLKTALSTWGLDDKLSSQLMGELSGGEKTRVLLAGIEINNPSVILLDEPTNYLDSLGRSRLYEFVKRSTSTLIIVSHDRTLLNLLCTTCELTPTAIFTYGGNYEFYKTQKEIMQNALQQQLEEKEKEIRQARKTAREVAERKEKQNIRGKKNNIKKGIPRMAMNTQKDKAEKSTTKLSDIHADRSEKLVNEISLIRKSLVDAESLKTNFNASSLHHGKILVAGKDINFSYEWRENHEWHENNERSDKMYPKDDRPVNKMLWKNPFSFQLKSGDRISIEGPNGCGKTTLLKLITGELKPTQGTITRSDFNYVYLNQEYSIIKNERSILEQAESFNSRNLPEHEVKTILNRYLFPASTWDKPCRKLSGGEKMRLTFCCLMINNNTPDLFILDEPTNNLDIQSIDIITKTIKDYTGTVVVVSHDKYFVKEIGIQSVFSYLCPKFIICTADNASEYNNE